MLGLTTVASNFVFTVPSEVAVCPYCGDRLMAQCEQWGQDDDGTWVADGLHLDCVSEPDLDDDDEASLEKWNDWLDQHTYMPYVYWLPVDLKVTAWVNKHFRFKMDHQ